LYTPMSNVLFDEMAKRQRGRFGTEMIPRSDSVRRALRVLRGGKPVMLAADMDFGLRDSVFVPFFGVPACTLTSVSRLAKAGNARVVPFVTEVLPDYRGYKLTIFEELSDFPSADTTVDARRITEFLESQVRRIPAQYYWVHKRFKHRPVGGAGGVLSGLRRSQPSRVASKAAFARYTRRRGPRSTHWLAPMKPVRVQRLMLVVLRLAIGHSTNDVDNWIRSAMSDRTTSRKGINFRQGVTHSLLKC
jgi:hypothetical protein